MCIRDRSKLFQDPDRPGMGAFVMRLGNIMASDVKDAETMSGKNMILAVSWAARSRRMKLLNKKIGDFGWDERFSIWHIMTGPLPWAMVTTNGSVSKSGTSGDSAVTTPLVYMARHGLSLQEEAAALNVQQAVVMHHAISSQGQLSQNGDPNQIVHEYRLLSTNAFYPGMRALRYALIALTWKLQKCAQQVLDNLEELVSHGGGFGASSKISGASRQPADVQ